MRPPGPDCGAKRRRAGHPEASTPDEESHDRGWPVVDEVGLDGGMLDRLRENRWRASGFNGSRQAHDADRHFNPLADSYWTLRKLLVRGKVALPDDERLFEELLAIRWRPPPQEKVQLEWKEDMKGRLGRSPGRAGAVAMDFAELGATERAVARIGGS